MRMQPIHQIKNVFRAKFLFRIEFGIDKKFHIDTPISNKNNFEIFVALQIIDII